MGGIHVLFCPIDDQKVVKHLLLFHNKESNIINLIKVSVSDMMMIDDARQNVGHMQGWSQDFYPGGGLVLEYGNIQCIISFKISMGGRI